MTTQVTLESPSISVYPPDTDLSLELNSEQASSPTQFTVHSVDSSPLGLHSPAHAPTSAFLSQTSQNQSPEHSNSVSHRNSLDSIRNSFNFHRNTQTQEEMIRNKKRHRGKIYRTLTLEESAYHEEYVYSASVDSVRPHGTNPPDEGSSARDILTKRHKYVYIHYLERVSYDYI
ncbi:hypothetical protein LOD99_4121 [Oopsacas minuta]|uniref:Uncharacterized protein n=1 Tax=Oopsacas minuta TaxID=111878 RepID=A0AAV7JWN3_9METZ|nr:hypothetical protein LOD99_4121 [Oopsacas minuta]